MNNTISLKKAPFIGAFPTYYIYIIISSSSGAKRNENVVERSFWLGIPGHYFLETNEK